VNILPYLGTQKRDASQGFLLTQQVVLHLLARSCETNGTQYNP